MALCAAEAPNALANGVRNSFLSQATPEQDGQDEVDAGGEADDRPITPEERKGFASYLVGYVES